MKRIAQFMLVLFITLGVLAGQAAVLPALAARAAKTKDTCKKCECPEDMPPCCIEKKSHHSAPQTPTAPPSETRWVQPGDLQLVPELSTTPTCATLLLRVDREISLSAPFSVPLFLRNRAILI